MFDISRIIPALDASWQQVATSATPQLLIPPDASRPVLYIQNWTSSPLLMVQDPTPPSGSIGQFQVAANDSLAFTWITDGPMSTLGWYLWTPAGAGVATFTSVRWIPSRLIGG